MSDHSRIVPFPQDGRPPPPEHLSLEEAETWKATVGARKAGFFGPEIFPLLEAYCATAMICDRIAAQLRELDEIDHEAYESYDGPVAEVSRPLISAATRSRNASRRSHGTMFAACMSSRNCVSVRAIGLMRARAREWP